MNQYVTGTTIKELREKNKITQVQLAEKLGVSDKTVSKWATPPFGTRLCEAKCSVLYALSALP